MVQDSGIHVNLAWLFSEGTKSEFAGSVERFPVPVVSQTGHPEAVNNVEAAADQPNRGKKESTWKFSSIFKTTKETKVDFRPPKATGESLVSFDEMLSMCPIIHVRLHDSQCESSDLPVFALASLLGTLATANWLVLCGLLSPTC